MASDMDWEQWERGLIDQIARGIRQAREQAGLSQRALADVAGISQGAVANVESGTSGPKQRVKQTPSVATLMRLAWALNVPPVQLVYPDLPNGKVEAWPSIGTTSVEALQWFSGDIPAKKIEENVHTRQSTNERVRRSRAYAMWRDVAKRAHFDDNMAKHFPEHMDMPKEQTAGFLSTALKELKKAEQDLRDIGVEVDDGA